MSFFDQNWDPTRRDDLDPRVNAWRSGEVNTAQSPGYTEQARQAQSSATGSTIAGGKIVKPVHAAPRDNLPSNVRGFHNLSKARPSSVMTEGPPPSTSHEPPNRPKPSARSGTPPHSVVGRSPNTTAVAGSASRLSGPAFVPNSRGSTGHNKPNDSSSTAPQPGGNTLSSAPTSSVGGASQATASRAGETPSLIGRHSVASSKAPGSIPPHLRHGPASDTASNARPADENSKEPCKMNAGKASKSAKYDSKFPCTYDDCSRGFMTKKALKTHKTDEHDYCRDCDVDFENHDALLEHKIYSEDHICCRVCGEDFRSEAGRDKHERQQHATPQEVRCPGCGNIFESGSGLIAHIYGNRCKTRDGSISNRINEFKIRESRAAAALFMDSVSHRPSNTGALIAAMQPPEIEDDQSVEGGVVVPHIMDEDVPEDGSIVPASALTEGSNKVGDLTYTEALARAGTPNRLADSQWPTVAQSMEKGKSKEDAVVQGLNNLKVGPWSGPDLKDPGWEEALFPTIKPIPPMGEWTAPTMPDYRRNIIRSASGSQHLIRTDWDAFPFERSWMHGNYDCPFTGCKSNFVDINDLKEHLTCGYHQGTDYRCLKCHKIFKTVPGLVSHMERSEKCRVRETSSFGNIIHVVSGGFLGVSGRHADGSIKIEAPDVPDEERHILRFEGDDEDEVVEPRLLMPPKRKEPTAEHLLD